VCSYSFIHLFFFFFLTLIALLFGAAVGFAPFHHDAHELHYFIFALDAP